MKTMTYWVGLILVGLSVWGIFVGLWILIPITKMRYIAKYGGPIILSVGIIIFLTIGLRMMKEAKRNMGEEDQRRE